VEKWACIENEGQGSEGSLGGARTKKINKMKSLLVFKRERGTVQASRGAPNQEKGKTTQIFREGDVSALLDLGVKVKKNEKIREGGKSPTGMEGNIEKKDLIVAPPSKGGGIRNRNHEEVWGKWMLKQLPNGCKKT